jgi:filamentous hemagglutinin family protein
LTAIGGIGGGSGDEMLMKVSRAWLRQHRRAQSARSLLSTFLITVFVSVLMVGTASANPQNGMVVGGNAPIRQTSPSDVRNEQMSNNPIVSWQSFSIWDVQGTIFQQPSRAPIVLNRVTGVDPSVILGRLTADRQIVLVNPKRILFGPDSPVGTRSLIATTANIRNEHFQDGSYSVAMPSSRPTATMVNQAGINVTEGGLAALVAPGRANSGVINARLGTIAMAATSGFTVDLYGDKLINIAINQQVAQQVMAPNGQPIKGAVPNAGKILIHGGTVQVAANVAKGVLDSAINMSGVVEARAVSLRGGKIILSGGNVSLSGKLYAAANSTNGKRGKVVILGQQAALDTRAKANVPGAAGGGPQGRGPVPQVYVDPATTINADALNKSNSRGVNNIRIFSPPIQFKDL